MVMEHENSNLFTEINKVCDKYNAPHLGTVAFNELCELYLSGNTQPQGDVKVNIDEINTRCSLQSFLEVTRMPFDRLAAAWSNGTKSVYIKRQQAQQLGLI